MVSTSDAADKTTKHRSITFEEAVLEAAGHMAKVAHATSSSGLPADGLGSPVI
jgi:hypothetical protein